MCIQATRNSAPVWSSKLPWKNKKQVSDIYRKTEQEIFIILEIFFFNSTVRTGWPVSGTLRERFWSGGKDQQDEPVRSLNRFQHKKSTLQKRLVSPYPEPPYTSHVCVTVAWSLWILWLFSGQSSLQMQHIAENCRSNHLCNILNATTQQLKSGIYRATFV